MRKKTVQRALLSTLILAAASAQAGFDIVRDGEPACAIYLADEATPEQKEGAVCLLHESQGPQALQS